ncbi:hypothetical protein PMIN04_012371 [Paraphaeosphaeria minitans]
MSNVQKDLPTCNSVLCAFSDPSAMSRAAAVPLHLLLAEIIPRPTQRLFLVLRDIARRAALFETLLCLGGDHELPERDPQLLVVPEPQVRQEDDVLHAIFLDHRVKRSLVEDLKRAAFVRIEQF